MAQKTLVCIGTGGARSYIENLARSGVIRFILIDGDVVSETNIATQSVYSDEINKYKTDVIKKRIFAINPNAKVTSVKSFLNERMTDDDFEKILGCEALLSPKDILIAGCTDSFYANARASRLALKYGTPYLQAGLYQDGVAAEIAFSYPGVTPACVRCCTSDRYDAYMAGFINCTNSVGSPIFASELLNSVKGFVSLVLLLYQSGGNRYSDYLTMIKTRNFIQIKLDPFASDIGISTFDRFLKNKESLFLGETLWIEQVPNHPQNGYELCRDCYGTGNLESITGNIKDTREIF